MASPQDRPRNEKSRFVRSPETAARDAEAAILRAQGWSYPAIAERLGFADRGDAHHAVQRAIADVIPEPAESLLFFELERLDAELERLNRLEQEVRAVLERRHITVSNGRVILHPETGEPMEDDGPVLQAADRLLKIEEARRRNGDRRAELTGIKAAIKVDHTVREVTQQDLELQEMMREAKAKMRAEEQRILDGGDA
ncbi:hypothetical protein M2155_000600 [Streptomyces sp. SAI-119]|uniref:hypothetical protein n=1 Tax=Streptomyces sp. SAI-119 TaxID=2940541 RepID=UPI0024751AD6|nr:hypothetical protein [Streptomyces sp. SAI-119]MDH6448192.1 hypothetical protein [Streptomyces sp. SAI-119]